MIIDCHGHYTTAPKELKDYRDSQIAQIKDKTQPKPAALKITDDQIRASIEGAQLKLQRERGTDMTIFSPRAAGMAPPYRRRDDQPELVDRLQRHDPPRGRAVPRQFRRGLPASPVAGRSTRTTASPSSSAA